jgi:hypothetical protein
MEKAAHISMTELVHKVKTSKLVFSRVVWSLLNLFQHALLCFCIYGKTKVLMANITSNWLLKKLDQSFQS